MFLDPQSKESLHLETLLARWIPLTEIGKQRQRGITPFLPGQEQEWQQLLDEQERIQAHLPLHSTEAKRIEEVLQRTPDPEGVLKKLLDEQIPSLTEWYLLKQCCWQVKEWSQVMEQAQLSSSLHLTLEERTLCESLLWKLNPTPPLRSTFSLDSGYDESLKECRKQLEYVKQEYQFKMELESQQIDQQYGVKRNRFGEWVVERGTQLEEQFNQDPRVNLIRKTIYDSIYQLEPRQTQEFNGQIQQLQSKIEQLEKEILERLADDFRPFVPMIQEWIDRLAHFDLQWARIKAAASWQGNKPIYHKHQMKVEQGIHPVVAERLKDNGSLFTPVDVSVSSGSTVIIGPNMGGKTVALKTIGIIAALAQYGLFVPAKSCYMPLFPWIATLIGDQQNIEQGLSSFGAEVYRLNQWINRDEPGLLLLDEIGKGTNPVEGAALAQAITHFLSYSSIWSVHVTHYREVIEVEGIRKYRVAGLCLESSFSMKTELTNIHLFLQERMDYRLLPLTSEKEIPKQALLIAEILGLHADIIEQAKTVMSVNREEA